MSALFGLGQTLLLALDPERAHDLALKTLELGVYPRPSRADDARLRQIVLGLDRPQSDRHGAGLRQGRAGAAAAARYGFGFVEVGTLTPRAQSGNPRPRVFRSHADRAIVNRLGFNNEARTRPLKRLRTKLDGIVGVNLGANRDSSDRIADYVKGIAQMGPVASYFTVNISSPNTPGLRDLQAPRKLGELLDKVQEARKGLGDNPPPLLVKLAPDLADADLPEVVRVIGDSGADGIVISNTTLARDGLSDETLIRETGGLSGRPLFDRATRMLARVYQITEGRLPLIGVGGIDSGETALAKIEAGASLIQLYTGLVFEGPGLIGRIKRTLVAAIDDAKANTLAPLIGRRADEWAEKQLPELVV
ncbi:quinone-dependent dihydroorotate dehydrogenase [Methyloceanibacter marginalis]|uniref:quinone-dependent dihydroorotate dehydrogenase n=1 Tax=Methyloceanibacter marginalis TaxID=1774971 RepID=UPI000A7BC2BD|nr:quinone-dependent dihydroorotate dehydrogenase [Methyloceanibacter marginalis]